MAAMRTEALSQQASTSSSWSVLDVICLAIFFPILLWSIISKDYVLAAAWCLVSLCGCSGLRAGAGGMVVVLLALCAAFYYGPMIGTRCEGEFTKMLGTTGLTNRLLSVVVSTAAIMLVIDQFCKCLVVALLSERKSLQNLNRYVGGLLGCIQGVAAVLLLVGGLFMIQSLTRTESVVNNVQLQNTSLSLMNRITDEAHRSYVGQWVKQYNPYEKIPRLNRFKDIRETVQILANPNRVQKMLANPEMLRLKADPRIQRSIRALQTDPEISKLLRGDRPLDTAAIIVLMDNQKLLELLDQPGFIESARRALK